MYNLHVVDSKELREKVAAACYKFTASDPGCFVATRGHFEVSCQAVSPCNIIGYRANYSLRVSPCNLYTAEFNKTTEDNEKVT